MVVRLMVALYAVVIVIALVNLSPWVDGGTVRYVFDMNAEANLVSWLSSALLLAIAGSSAYAAASAGRDRVGWIAISALFVLLSADETARLHEQVGRLAARVVKVSWLPGSYVWVIVLGPIAAVAAGWMLVWMRRAIGRIAFRMAIAAVVAWVLVLVPEAIAPSLGPESRLFVLEESLEFAGEILMLGAVAWHLVDRRSVGVIPITVSLATPEEGA
jgi:hypothetical protein